MEEDVIDFENMSAKEILQNWNKLNYLLGMYEVEIEYGDNKNEFTEKYNKLKLMLRKVENALETLNDKQRIVVQDIYFIHKKWDEVIDEHGVSYNTLARCLRKAYKAIDDLAILKG